MGWPAAPSTPNSLFWDTSLADTEPIEMRLPPLAGTANTVTPDDGAEDSRTVTWISGSAEGRLTRSHALPSRSLPVESTPNVGPTPEAMPSVTTRRSPAVESTVVVPSWLEPSHCDEDPDAHTRRRTLSARP